ncbi:papain family cysteine protease [Dictyocaulus viviparus]|uniref:Papain family cysteine protease n=1 Tax=Dictyocaulus viviparus TaxID=29172 RepID=A0A0D8XXP3_DICVI|nr:papain family cysteine protease [Dictyocaulus viviparus]
MPLARNMCAAHIFTGSCWAFGAVEAMSDRICIASMGKIQVPHRTNSKSYKKKLLNLSIMLSRCDGGDPMAAWKYWVREGIVTGSNFTENKGCKPYPFPPCEHHSNKTHFDPCRHDLYPTPKCEKKCVSSYKQNDYEDDKFYGKSSSIIANLNN